MRDGAPWGSIFIEFSWHGQADNYDCSLMQGNSWASNPSKVQQVVLWELRVYIGGFQEEPRGGKGERGGKVQEGAGGSQTHQCP